MGHSSAYIILICLRGGIRQGFDLIEIWRDQFRPCGAHRHVVRTRFLNRTRYISFLTEYIGACLLYCTRDLGL